MQTTNERILLVVGEVSAKQYREANFALVKAGYKPKVQRVECGEFFMDDMTLARLYGPVEQRGEIGRLIEEDSDKSAETLKECISLAAAAYAASLGEVATVVMDEDTWDDWSYATNLEIVRAMENRFTDLTRWVAYPNGSVEYAA